MGSVRKLRVRATKSPKSPTSSTSDGRSRSIVSSPDRFPHLSTFLAGYLHQDFTLDHKTPADALRAFLAEASTKEREALERDWRSFLDASSGLQWRYLRAAFLQLGGAWQPASRAALLALFEALKHKS